MNNEDLLNKINELGILFHQEIGNIRTSIYNDKNLSTVDKYLFDLDIVIKRKIDNIKDVDIFQD